MTNGVTITGHIIHDVDQSVRSCIKFKAGTPNNVGNDKLAFLCGLVNPPLQPYTYVEEVRAAQTALPQQMRRTGVVSTNGLQKNTDNLHYNATGQLELGLRFAKAYLNIEKAFGNEAVKGAALSAANDPFAIGQIWSGVRTFAPLPGVQENFWLIVTERDGQRFKGEVFFMRGAGKDDFCKVEGSVASRNDGSVTLTTEKKGLLQLNFQGKLSNGELVLSYSGSSYNDGSGISGTANLKP